MNQLTQEEADVLIQTLAEFRYDPVGFAYWAFPWGEPGELEAYEGPLQWQIDVLQAVKDGIVDISTAIRIARTSGHGIGKSALVSILIIWAMSTCAGAKCVITANTDTQLRTKTHPEVSKWFRLFIGNPLFKLSATAMYAADPEMEKEWRADFIPWSEKNPAAFAGLHNKGKRILIIFDEASEIADIIWETILGALTDRDTEIIWAVFGNPTKTTGMFRECFEGGRFAQRWNSKTISSLSVEITNHEELQAIIDDWGEDSRTARVRVLGRFPQEDGSSFISRERAEAAAEREVPYDAMEPIVIGCDVARFGDDYTIIYPRQGLDAKSREIEIYQGLDTMAVAAKCVAAMRRHGARSIFVDEGGLGAGVVDRLRQLDAPVVGVNFSDKAKEIPGTEGESFTNHRAEIWGAMRNWLKLGCIDGEVSTLSGVSGKTSLIEELIGPQYELDAKDKIKLESKKDMKRRGVASPNIADALAVTFSEPMLTAEELRAELRQQDYAPAETSYDPYDLERIYA